MVTGQSKNGYFETKMVTTPLKCTPQRKLIRFIALKISGSRRNVTTKKKKERNVLKSLIQLPNHTIETPGQQLSKNSKN